MALWTSVAAIGRPTRPTRRTSDPIGAGRFYRALTGSSSFADASFDASDVVIQDIASEHDARAADAPDADARDATFGEICRALEREFQAFVAQNNSCTSSSECTYVVGVRDCSCNWRGIGSGSGSGVLVSVQDETQKFVERWDAAGCDRWRDTCVMDSGPSNRVECLQGKCVANVPPGCLMPPQPEPCQ